MPRGRHESRQQWGPVSKSSLARVPGLGEEAGQRSLGLFPALPRPPLMSRSPPPECLACCTGGGHQQLLAGYASPQPPAPRGARAEDTLCSVEDPRASDTCRLLM